MPTSGAAECAAAAAQLVLTPPSRAFSGFIRIREIRNNTMTDTRVTKYAATNPTIFRLGDVVFSKEKKV